MINGRSPDPIQREEHKSFTEMPIREPAGIKNPKNRTRACRREITKLTGAIADLSAERDHFSQIFNNANDGIIIHDEKGCILEINEPYCRRLGYDRSEMLKLTLGELVPPELSRLIPQRMRLLRRRGTAIFESQDRRKDGTIMPVEVSATRVKFRGRNVIQSVVRDIHERKLAEELIKATQAENARLLNDLQRQSRYIFEVLAQTLDRIAEDIASGSPKESLLAVLDRQRCRVANIAFVQKMLYDGPAARLVDMEIPIRRLVPLNFNQFRVSPCRVSTSIDVGGIVLDKWRAVPLCLLIAELLSNALQHAFPGDIPGQIEIRLTREGSGGYVLVFADTGVGISGDFQLRKWRTLGMQLVMDLIAHLDGAIKLRKGRGTTFVVRFS